MDTTLLQYEIEEMANIGSYETDVASGTWNGSQNFIKIFGLTPKEKYSVEEFQALVHPDDFSKVMQDYKNCLHQGEVFNCDYRCLKPDGQIIYVHSRSKIIRSADGTPVRIVGIKQDITELKLYTLKLARLNELIHQKSEILANVAHDLKSPLSSIEGLISLLRSQEHKDNDEYWDLMENACGYASELVHDIMDMSEMESLSGLPRQKLNINELLEIAVERLNFIALKKHIHIKTNFSEDTWAEVNRIKITRAFTNLLSNAIKFSFPHGSVFISTYVSGDFIHISIKDEGMGMHADELKQLFWKFSSVSKKGTSGEKSTGLGLYIVKQIIDLHHGKIHVESQLQKGSTFRIDLPLSQIE